MPNINLNYKMVTDIKNNFFTNNRFIAAESLPAEGDFVKGDLIVNIGENANDKAMWLCVESGNPGVWEVVGAGAGGGSSKIVTLKSRVVVNEALSEVNIGVSGFNKATDTLIVFNNARFMVEGVDYEINADSTKIVAMNGNIWNEELANDFVFDFVVFKMMNVNENGDVVVSSANEIVKLKNTVVVNEAVNEVEIGIDGFNEGDDLTVYKNSVYMMEGIDYEINTDSNKIILNEVCAVGSIFAFEVIKTVAKINPDAVVGMEHLNEDVRGAIEAAGNIDLSGKQDKTDNGLVTTDKTIVGAINELFQNANNGKELIANAIGEPLSSNDTFSAMSDKINDMKSDLKQVLTDEGVSVSNTDTMASLITKIDSEFDRQVVPAGDAVAANVLSGKTFINITGQTVTGTMANNGAKTFTPSASQQTAPAGYYSGITCNAIAGLSAVNIVKGVTVGGVTGTASVAKAKANAGTAIQLWTRSFSFTGLQSPQTYTSSIIPVDGQYTFNLLVSNDGYGAAIIIKTNTGRVLLNTSVYQPDDDPRSFLYEFTLYSGETLVLTPSTSGGSSYRFQGSFTLSCGSFSAI